MNKKVIVEHKKSFFSDELYFDDIKRRRYSVTKFGTNFEISVDRIPIYKGSRMIDLYFNEKRVEAEGSKGSWTFKLGRFDRFQLCVGRKRMNCLIALIEHEGKVIGRISHSNKLIYCNRRYIVNWFDDNDFSMVFFAFNFYLNEKSRTYTQ